MKVGVSWGWYYGKLRPELCSGISVFNFVKTAVSVRALVVELLMNVFWVHWHFGE